MKKPIVYLVFVSIFLCLQFGCSNQNSKNQEKAIQDSIQNINQVNKIESAELDNQTIEEQFKFQWNKIHSKHFHWELINLSIGGKKIDNSAGTAVVNIKFTYKKPKGNEVTKTEEFIFLKFDEKWEMKKQDASSPMMP